MAITLTPTIDDIRDAVRGTAATLDISKFYQWTHCDCPQTMVCDDVTTWAVLYPTLLPLPLGGNSGQISDRVVSIWQKRNIGPVVKWCDDFAMFCPRKKYGYTKQSALKLVKELNVPWHAEKGQDFASTFTHVGLEWDIENKMVVLPEKKSKMLQQVETQLYIRGRADIDLDLYLLSPSSYCQGLIDFLPTSGAIDSDKQEQPISLPRLQQ
ncbi:hypothetical protein BDN72DRAFT_914801 [Pluteus cervinus]|uniref:Uncharacterized protein n=1 Tax=Pluteus cervinus TaxID=181527 RepID=A0ACD2ZXN8_9AGAR|nr:hypothetical protein BDN72DRAFT_914801 [Pluteus cervinus]